MTHSTTQLTPSTIKRFWSKVARRGSDNCWEWQAHTNADGYGHFATGSRKDGTKRMVYAHRLSYELHHGEIPNGMHILHSCDENYPKGDISYRACVNPAHLWLGTNSDNVADMVDKGRQAKGIRFPQAKLTPENVRHIRALRKTGMTYKDIAARFGVGETAIRNIVIGKTWSHVEAAEAEKEDKPARPTAEEWFVAAASWADEHDEYGDQLLTLIKREQEWAAEAEVDKPVRPTAEELYSAIDMAEQSIADGEIDEALDWLHKVSDRWDEAAEGEAEYE